MPQSGWRHSVRYCRDPFTDAQIAHLQRVARTRLDDTRTPATLALVLSGAGVVMKIRKGETASAALHETGVGKVYGSKYTVFSARINGQYMSRLIFDLVHTTRNTPARTGPRAAPSST